MNIKPTCACGKCKFKVTKKMQEEMNEIRKKCGFPEEPIVPEYELEMLKK
jgi:tryptophanyl-tRNA synthetase